MSGKALLPDPSQTRLVTIVAHVDHGKTTLADNLIESNGIISERLAGTMRYLDSMEEEQRRGITMRASAIGLRHVYTPPKPASALQQMVIHLIDSPGHVDFSFEVTSSLLLCDGALLVVDAVEGMCARTHSILREAYAHELVPVLVINKIDRLCTDLCLTPTEAYVRLRGLVESINAAAAAMIISYSVNSSTNTSRPTSMDSDSHTHPSQDQEQQPPPSQRKEEGDHGFFNFDPNRGNVVFASALHGWGFTVPSLARSLFRSKTVPIKPPVMRQYLFGDFKYHSDTSKITKWKSQSSDAPMFAEFALAPLWNIYEGVSGSAAAMGIASEIFVDGRKATTNDSQVKNTTQRVDTKIRADTPGMDQVIAALQTGDTTGSSVPESFACPKTVELMQKMMNRTGASAEESILRAVLRRYRPLSEAVLSSVCEHCPSPAVASSTIRNRALALRQPKPPISTPFANIQSAVRNCDALDNVPTVAHVCKFMATDRASVTDPELAASFQSDEEGGGQGSNDIIMGLARVLSGTLRSKDVEYYMYGPRFNKSDTLQKQSIRLYLLMGSSFVRVESVPAGHICAVYNLENLHLKTVTLCDRPDAMPLRGFDQGVRPLVKVSVEPASVADADALERGLAKLTLADSAVEVTTTAKGERILACLGEIHLEQSIRDLERAYCGREIKLQTSAPIVEFGECTEWFENEVDDYEQFFDSKVPPLLQVTAPPYCEEEGLQYARRGRTRAVLSGRGAAIGIRVVPLSQLVYDCLEAKKVMDGSEDHILTLGKALGYINGEESTDTAAASKRVLATLLNAVCSLDENHNAILESKSIITGDSVKAVLSNIGEVYIPPSSLSTAGDTKSKTENTYEDVHAKVNSDDGKEEYEQIHECIRSGGLGGTKESRNIADEVALEIWKTEMRGSAVAGFQLAMRSGPLCEEPVRGVLVILESVEVALKKEAMEGNTVDTNQMEKSAFVSAKPLSGGHVVSALRSGIRCSLLTRPARLVESHLRLTLHTSFAGLGPLYAVLTKRRGKVLTDSMVDGTDLLLISASLPQAESFGLAPELYKKSSGEVTAPELVFSHWEVLNEDPFWTPTSLEEREDYGENLLYGDRSTGLNNNALKYIRMVRERKGLLVDSSKIVVAAEKQSTLSRKK